MIEILRAVVLGIVQGATEFIPVSSSAHLVIVPWLMGWPDPSLLFDTVLHWGTLLALLLVFGQDVWTIVTATAQSLVRRSWADPHARLGWFIILGSLPAVVAGLLFEDFFDALFSSPVAAGSFLFVTAAILVGSEALARRRVEGTEMGRMSGGQALAVGLAQALALAPGISRSGSTIATGMVTGLKREASARFSFLLSMPVVFGAGLLQLAHLVRDGADSASVDWTVAGVGFVTSAVVGYLVIRGLLAYLRRNSLYIFAAYCVLLGLVVLGLAWIA